MNLLKPRTNISRGDGVTGNTLDYLISTTVTNNNADWNILTAYVVGDKVVLDFDLYQCLQDNTGENPSDAASTFWVRIGSANKYAMFDGVSTSQTSFDGTNFVVVISGFNVNAIGFFGVNASSISVVQDNGGTETYNETKTTGRASEGVDNWWNYFFSPFPDEDSVRDVVFTDIPLYSSSEITITFTLDSGDAKVGMLTAGLIRNIGQANFGTSVGITDYSIKETNDFGVVNLVERQFNNTVDYDVTVLTPQVAQVRRLLASYRATPVVWIGDPDREETINFGYYQDFEIQISNYSISECTIDVQGI